MWMITKMFELPKHDSAAAARQLEAFHQQFPHVRNMRESDLVGQSLEGAAAPPPRGPIALQFPSMRADHHGEMLAIRYCIQDGGCGLATVRTGNNEVGLLRAPDGMQMTAYTLSRDGTSLFAAITCGTHCNPPYEPNFIVEIDVATRRIVWAKPLHRLYVAGLAVDETKSQFVLAIVTSRYSATFGASTGFQKLVAFQRESGTGEELQEVEILAPQSNSYLFSGYEHLHWCADGRVVAVARLVGQRVTSADLMREAGADESWAIHNRTWGGQFGLIVEVSRGYGARVIPSMSKLAGLDSWNGVAFVAADGQCREFVARLARLSGPPLIFRMDRTSVREADLLAQSIRAVSGDGGPYSEQERWRRNAGLAAEVIHLKLFVSIPAAVK